MLAFTVIERHYSAMARNHTKTELKFELFYRLIDLVRHAIEWGGYLGLAYFATQAVADLSGKETFASFFLQVLGKESASDSLVLLLAIVFGGWALLERRLRRRKTAELSQRIQHLETLIDPNRTGSRLTPTGETHPGDH
jgi:hypothetical protein